MTRLILLLVLCCFAMASLASAAMNYTLTANPRSIDVGQSIYLSNSTSGGVPPYFWTVSLPIGSQGTMNGNAFTFKSPGIYTINGEAWDSTANSMNYTYASATVYVNATLGVSLAPLNATEMLGQNILIQATIKGGTPRFRTQWYNNTACNSPIANTTNATSYLTPKLNATATYCIRVWDNRSENASQITILTPQRLLVTSSGIDLANSQGSYETLVPGITSTENGIVIANLTTGEYPNISICGTQERITLSSISPDSVVLLYNNGIVNLPEGIPEPIQSYVPNCDAELENVTWAGIGYLHLASLAVFTYVPTTTSTSSTSTIATISTIPPSTTTIASSKPTTTIVTPSNIVMPANLSGSRTNTYPSKPQTSTTQIIIAIVGALCAAIAVYFFVSGFTKAHRPRQPPSQGAPAEEDRTEANKLEGVL